MPHQCSSVIEAREQAVANTALTGDVTQCSKGRVYYIIGASGCGKDSLISAIRQHFVNDVVVAHRYITRAADAGGENHVELTEDEFFVRYSRNMFAMSWKAHGFSYGIGQEVLHWSDLGLSVVVNGSRAYLDVAKELFGERLVPVVIHVDTHILEQRLIQRGREDSEQIAQRLKRASEYRVAKETGAFFIDNGGTLEQSVEQFSTLKQSLESNLELNLEASLKQGLEARNKTLNKDKEVIE
ncbi:ribose 1,5-bisphosphokinase [uncultured Vibrio sp.]|uniref:ribose 1,5-bisphosphokinase n=1 Tax=uncultured Vibrio sp. TaxID=114054 RepID=UPI0025EEB2C4|nr:ribose 1,5-bisphosphokinase [uncultured Vibrio sp.]